MVLLMNIDSSNMLTSCGGVVIYRNKVLLLYKNHGGRHVGWVMPKGNVETNETEPDAALREVKEESGVSARIIKYIGDTQYSFRSIRTDANTMLYKTVHWYLMSTNSFYCKPQAEEFFTDAGFYKRHEAEFLLKFHDEKQIMRKAFAEYDKRQYNKET